MSSKELGDLPGSMGAAIAMVGEHLDGRPSAFAAVEAGLHPPEANIRDMAQLSVALVFLAGMLAREGERLSGTPAREILQNVAADLRRRRS